MNWHPRQKTLKLIQNFMGKQFCSKIEGIDIPCLKPSDIKYGNLLDVGKAGGYHDFLTKHHNELGPIFYFWVFNNKVVSLGHPKYWGAISHLSDKTNFIRLFMKGLFGSFKTIALSNSQERAKRYEKYITPFINQKTVEEKHTPIFERRLPAIIESWREVIKKNQPIPLIEKLSIICVDTMLELLIGIKPGQVSEAECIKLYKYLTFSIINIELQSFEIEINSALQDEIRTKIDYIHTFIRNGIKDRLSKGVQEKICLVDYLKEEPDIETIHTDVATFFFASIHNPLLVLLSSIYHLASNPNKEALLQEELNKSLKGKEVNGNTIKPLRYLRLCINETLRITPAVATSSRVDFNNDITLPDGYIIPKNTTFITPFGIVSTSPEIYEDNLTFCPERFKPGFSKYNHQFSPFGFAGGRVCPGKNIALQQCQLILASLFKHFTFSVGSSDSKGLNLYLGTGTVCLDEVYVNAQLKI